MEVKGFNDVTCHPRHQTDARALSVLWDRAGRRSHERQRCRNGTVAGESRRGMPSNDPEVAVMNMRRAALMAKLLVKIIMRMSQPPVSSKARNSALFTGTWLSCHGHLSPGRKPTAGLFLGLWNPLARLQQRSIDDFFFGHEGNARDPPAPKAVHLRGQSRIG